MKLFLLQCLFIIIPLQVVFCQTEDFEDETDNTTTFTEMTTGTTFNVTSNFEIQVGGPFGAGGSNGWLDSQAGNPVTGVVGEIQATGITASFKLTQLAAWTSANNAASEASGTVIFTGTPAGGGAPLVEAIFVDPPNISTYDIVTFTGDLAGAEITALEVSLAGSGLNYIGLDNIVFSEIFLPVEMLSFEAEDNGKGQTRLNWTTASELNNDKFEIERSGNGKDFISVGTVKGNGTSLEPQAYSFTDKSPLPGISYYRLKQIDFDGGFEYSRVISIQLEGNEKRIGEFYPNPSQSGMVDLDYYTTDKDERITVSVIDITGRQLISQIYQVVNGNNKFNFSTLGPGVYMARLGNHTDAVFRKFMIK